MSAANVTSIPPVILQLRLAPKYFSIYFALPLCVLGILGNFLNILVFLDLGTYKHNASSFYTFYKSFFDLTALIIGLALRVLQHGFHINFSVKSRVWCKMRVALLEVGILNSFTFLCLQSIDAFFSSSTAATWRKKSDIRTARCISVIFFIIWASHQVPYIIFQDLVSVNGTLSCRTTNIAYGWYRNYFFVTVFANIVPIVVISVFGFLAYRNLQIPAGMNIGSRPRKRSVSLSHLTRQMTSMTLFQIIVVSLCQTPFAIAQVYSCATEMMIKTTLHQAQEQLIQMIVVTCSYGTPGSSFYCYFIASKRFRQQVFDVLNQCKFNRKNPALPAETTSHNAT